MEEIFMQNATMANREVCDLIFVDYATKKPFMNLDFANVSTTELTGESLFAYGGKGHPKRVQFSGEKGGTLTIETQMQTVKLWQLITGGEVSKSAKFITRMEAVTDDAGTSIALSDTALAGGSKVIVYFMKEVTTGVQRINIKSTSFPKNFIVYGDTVMKTENDELLPYKLTAYKVAPQSNMSLSFSNSGDPGTITITCDLMADDNDNILDLALIEE